MKYWILISYVLSVLYIHFRGQERLGFLRQVFDHSSLLAPINIIMYAFSAVPKTPFLNVNEFPELQLLRDNWQVIRDEAIFLYAHHHISASDKYDDIGFNSFFRRGWKRFYVKWYAKKPLSSAVLMCPQTVTLIQQIPSINAAMFALLPKNGFLFKHRDPYAGSLRYHLGLMTPNHDDCCIYVDGQRYIWRDGEDVIFDETYVHAAENKTDQDRIILFCDIKRPSTNKLCAYINTLFSHTVMRASASKNIDTDKVGLINKGFLYLYQIRLIAKEIKKTNKSLYYFLKYSLFIAIFYTIFIK